MQFNSSVHAPTMKIRKKLELNSVFQTGNIIFCLLLLILYIKIGDNEYINVRSIWLFLLMGIQNSVFLLYEKKRRDPFIIILIYINLFFYLLRGITLILVPWSITFLRYSLSQNDLNNSLLFIVLANLALFCGIQLGNFFKKKKESTQENYLLSNPAFIILFMLTIIVTNTFGLMGLGLFQNITRILSGVFLNIFILIFLTIIYLVTNYDTLKPYHRVLLYSVIILYLISISLIGSRSGVLSILQFLLFSLLAFREKISLSLKSLLYGIGFGIVAIFLFFFSTFIRTTGYGTETKITLDRINAAKEFNVDIPDLEIIIRPLTDRLGFLDYAADLISNGKNYNKIINHRYYLKSIIDNGITPGFNIFDNPKASQALRYTYTGISNVARHSDIQEEYNSDMFTMYGEFYILFGGYKSLIVIFIAALFFKTLYLSVNFRDKFIYIAMRSIILLIFCNWINSFGFDWMIIELISIILTVFFFRMILLRKRQTIGLNQ